MRSRLAGWLVTGPLAHGYAGCADAAGLVLGAARRRIGDHRARAREGLRRFLDAAATASARRAGVSPLRPATGSFRRAPRRSRGGR